MFLFKKKKTQGGKKEKENCDPDKSDNWNH